KARQAMSDAGDQAARVSSPAPLPLLIHRLIRNYVLRKTEEKSGITWERIKDNKDNEGRTIIPPEFREARQKVASDAFLAIRSRREQDFVDYFTASICSVAQFLPEGDYQTVAKELLQHPENVKTLSLLALSANS